MPASTDARTHDADAPAIEEYLSDRDLVVVSNREPYSHEYDGDDVTVSRPVGGLTAALDPVMRSVGGTWVAWGSGDADEAVVDGNDRFAVPPTDPAYTLRRVWLNEADLDGYYYGYSNQVLWSLCHSLPSKVHYDDAFWNRYRAVNDRFAEAVLDEVDGTDPVVWFQDYHLGLAPRLVRDHLGFEADLVHFWHIPWPPWDVFRRCPHGPELLTGMLSNDLVGFHTEVDRRQFVECAREVVDATYDPDDGTIRYDDHDVHVRSAPIQIDATDVAERAGTNDAATFWDSFAREHGLTDVRVALGVDRLDYTKGIPERLAAVERLFEEYPGLRGEVTLVQKGAETRTEIDAYRDLHCEIRSKVEAINDRFGTADWQPIVFTTDHLARAELVGLYRNADVALVSPVRDGLNLVAKEFVAAQGDDPGVLVLSESAGAATELGDNALTVTPLDTGSFAETIQQAIDMPTTERRKRIDALAATVREGDRETWIGRLFDPLFTVGPKEGPRTDEIHVPGT